MNPDVLPRPILAKDMRALQVTKGFLKLAPFFEKIDLQRLKVHQFAFISQALGGPHPYAGPSLVQAHAGLQIEQRHFDGFVAHLRTALRQIGAGDDLAAEIMSNVTPLSGVIVNHKADQ